MTRLPQWRDQDAVANWAYVELEEAWSEAERQHCMLRWDRHPGLTVPRPQPRQVERRAVAEARHGNFEPLADLIRSAPARDVVQPSTWELIVDILAGNFKASPGRRKMTENERRATTPVHDAADDVATIRAILRKGYPKQSQAEVRDLALYAASRHHKIEVKKLAKYLSRPPGDRRRRLTPK